MKHREVEWWRGFRPITEFENDGQVVLTHWGFATHYDGTWALCTKDGSVFVCADNGAEYLHDYDSEAHAIGMDDLHFALGFLPSASLDKAITKAKQTEAGNE